MISFTCPRCDSELEISDKKAGLLITCPECVEKEAPKKEAPKKEAPKAGRSRKTNGKGTKAVSRASSRDDDDEPAKSSFSSTVLAVVAGGVILLLLGGGAVAVLMNRDKDNKDTPVATNNPGFRQPMNVSPITPQNAGGPVAGDSGTSTTTPPTDNALPTFESQPITGQDIYKRVLKSTVWILVPFDREHVSAGSGSLVDRQNRIILTNFHVVGNSRQAAVFFPRFRGTEQVASRKDFLDELEQNKSDLLLGSVIARDTHRDLALIQLPKLPEGVLALRPAETSPAPGNAVHSVGNPGASGALFAYTPGTVKQVYPHKWQARGGDVVFDLEAKVIETTSPTNPGDSGGPLVNDRAELVGVTHGGSTTANSISLFIDVTEVRDFVGKSLKTAGMTWQMETEGGLSPSGANIRPGDILALIRGLESSEAVRRSKCAAMLGTAGNKAQRAVPYLVKMAADSDQVARLAAMEALPKIGAPARDDAAELGKLLSDKSPDVRGRAAEALALMGADAQPAVKPVLAALQQMPEPAVRRAALITLGKAGSADHDAVFPVLVAGLKDSDGEIRGAAAEGLKAFTTTAADVPVLVELLANANFEVRAGAAEALGRLGPQAKAAVPKLTEALTSGRSAVAAAEALGKIGAEARGAAPKLLDALRADDETLGRAAAAALAQLMPLAKNDQDALTRLLGDAKPRSRAMGLLVLTKCDTTTREAAIPQFLDALKDQDRAVRLQAVQALAAFAPAKKELVPRLGSALTDLDLEVRKTAVEAVAKYGPGARDALTSLQAVLRQHERDKDYLGRVLDVLAALGPDARTASKDVAALLDNPEVDKDVAGKAFHALVTMGATTAPLVVAKLGASNKDTRLGAARALGKMGVPLKTNIQVVQGLGRVMQTDPDAEVRDACKKALQDIGAI